MGKSEFLLQLAIFGAAAAIIALIVIKVYPSTNNKTLTPNSSQSAEISKNSSKVSPNLVKIPAIGLQLPVVEAFISQNQWVLFDDKVSWLATSETPGEGNVILYAHNRENLFGPLKKVSVGDEILIEHKEKTLNYYVTEKRKVTPEDVDAILSKENQLTLYTCDGSFDQKRLIVVAVPVLVK